ncbi:hypothetical protein EZL74_05605 [Flavobacterium silvisoli]|uniref:Uncharacterized protein n=1 Tax=Flavobacterium silvisoli TaxID=2529433 RepID=A0A4Q9Z5U5_9FLAO|nr:hypothetical protein [Flavobacterium silvisoli]TBX69891.1 hypothetical protein EZL74_05605 [Flavobacterium silvisoli]
MKTRLNTLLMIPVTIFALIFSLLLSSCSSDSSSNTTSYPKNVEIMYRVTSTTTNSTAIVQYKNETGGNTDVTNASLPYTKSLQRTVNKNDVLSLGYGTNTNQTVKLEILVGNTVVKSQTFQSTSGAVTYLFE